MAAPRASKAVAVAAPENLSHDALMALLQQSGMAQTPSSDFRRLRLDNGTLVALDSQGEVLEMFPPKFQGKTPLPAVTLRIVEPPKYYNAFWLDADESNGGFNADRIGRPELNKSFAKHYDDPADQAADKNPSNEVYDDIARATNKRGDFKADLKVQIVPASGQMTGDEPVYTLTLSASAAIDWRGSRKNQTGGVVQDKNFIVQLAEFAATAAAGAGGDQAAQAKAVLDAMTALRLGGVVADCYLLRASNEDGSRSWTVPAFVPVHIEYPDAAAALPAGDDPLATDSDDLPGF